MKSSLLWIAAAIFIAIFTFSVQAQEQKKTPENEKIEKSANTGKEAIKIERQYLVGSRGGCYYLNASGKKSYVDKKFCEELTAPKSETKTIKPEVKTEAEMTDIEKIEAKSKELTTGETKAQMPEVTETKLNKAKTVEAVTPESKPTEAKTEAAEESDNPEVRTYIKGSRGGCYYLNDSGKKIYVKDKSLCGL